MPPHPISDITTWIRDLFSKSDPVPQQSINSPISGITTWIQDGFSKSDQVVHHTSPNVKEIFAKLLSAALSVAITVGIGYVGLKLMSDILDPSLKDQAEVNKRAKQILSECGISKKVDLSLFEMRILRNLVHPRELDAAWEDIGGLDETIQDLKESVLVPFMCSDLLQECGSKLYQAPKGLMLYGPPGCGKTMIAKAIAKTTGARFLNLDVSSIFDKWYGESQKRVAAIFTLSSKIQPTILFIDEIDGLLSSRDLSHDEVSLSLKTQFMAFWDGLLTDPSQRILIIGATNRINSVDPAILRRMPTKIKIGLPGVNQREHIMRRILAKERVCNEVFSILPAIAQVTDKMSGSDLKELCRQASINRVRKLMGDKDFDVSSSFNVDNLELQVEDFHKAMNTFLIQHYERYNVAAPDITDIFGAWTLD